MAKKEAQARKKSAEVVPIRPDLSIPLPPAQYDLFTGEPKVLPIRIDRDFDDELRVSDDIVLVRSGDAAQLVLSGFGLFLSKKSDRLIVKKGKDLLYEFPFFRLSEVTVASRGITLSSDVILELCQRGVQINFMQGTGKPFEDGGFREAKKSAEPPPLFRQVPQEVRPGPLRQGGGFCRIARYT
jgi:hypothetical protein